MAFYCYIMYAESFDRFYIVQCQDIQERLLRHNKGYNQSTKPYRPWKLYAWKMMASRSESMATERKIKNLRSRARTLHGYSQRGQYAPE